MATVKKNIKVGDICVVRKGYDTCHCYPHNTQVEILAPSGVNMYECKNFKSGKPVIQYVLADQLFCVGDRVRIAKTSPYYGIYVFSKNSNPKDIDGTISHIPAKLASTDNMPIQVEWDNGTHNVYSSNDLQMSDEQVSTKTRVFKVDDLLVINEENNASHQFKVNEIVTVVGVAEHDGSHLCRSTKRPDEEWWITVDDAFMVGDEVMIREDSDYYDDGDSNPRDMRGIIYQIRDDTDLPICVQWENEKTNTYGATDLYIVIEEDISCMPVISMEEEKPAKYIPKNGDLVRISRHSDLYAKGRANPPNTTGVIIRDNKNGTVGGERAPYEVKWPKELINTYREKDLVVVKRS